MALKIHISLNFGIDLFKKFWRQQQKCSSPVRDVQQFAVASRLLGTTVETLKGIYNPKKLILKQESRPVRGEKTRWYASTNKKIPVII